MKKIAVRPRTLILLLLGFGLCGGPLLLLELGRHALLEAVRRETRVTAPETGYRFPALSDIDRMTAAIDSIDPGGSVSEFDIPEYCWREIIDALSPSQLDPLPAPWTVLGSLQIKLKGGGKCELDLFEVASHHMLPEVPLIGAFAVESDSGPRRCYRGGYTWKLRAVLERAHSEYEKIKAPEVPE